MKSKIKHTLGPWKIEDESCLGRHRTTIKASVKGKPHSLIVVDSWVNPIDARLMAAAPELLEALALLLHGAEYVQACGVDQVQINRGIFLARAVISKLTPIPNQPK